MLCWSEFVSVLVDISFISDNLEIFSRPLEIPFQLENEYLIMITEPVAFVAYKCPNFTSADLQMIFDTDMRVLAFNSTNNGFQNLFLSSAENRLNTSAENQTICQSFQNVSGDVTNNATRNPNYIGSIPFSSVKNLITPKIGIVPLTVQSQFLRPGDSNYPIVTYTYFAMQNKTGVFDVFEDLAIPMLAAVQYFGVCIEIQRADYHNYANLTLCQGQIQRSPIVNNTVSFFSGLIVMLILLIVAMVLYQMQRCVIGRKKGSYSVEAIRQVFVPSSDLRIHIGYRNTAPDFDNIDLEFFAEDVRVMYTGNAAMMFRGGEKANFSRKSVNLLLKCINFNDHANLLPFSGVVRLKSCYGLLFEGTTKGSLHDVLQTVHFDLGNNVNGALANDAASGLKFLHDAGLVHGKLSSFTCFVDNQWTVKLGDYVQLSENDINSSAMVTESANLKEHLLFVDPSILSGDNIKASQKADIYCYGMILIEIYTKQLPFAYEIELLRGIENVLYQIKHHSIAPDLSEVPASIPIEIKKLINWTSRKDIRLRPNILEVIDFIGRQRIRRKGIVDSIMETMENHTKDLENYVEERSTELKTVTDRMEKLLDSILPKEVAHQLQQGNQVPPTYFEQVSVYFSDIVGFPEMCVDTKPIDIVNMLNALYTEYDIITEKYDVYKVETIVNTAARMKTTGSTNQIHASATTANIIMLNFPEFTCQLRGQTFVKGKGEMSTYLITKNAESIDEMLAERAANLPAGTRDNVPNAEKLLKIVGAFKRRARIPAKSSQVILELDHPHFPFEHEL